MNAFVAKPAARRGIVVAIGRGKQFTLRTAGVANIVTKAKPAANDQMRMASVAKAFSGAAALSLVSRGKLKLSDTVGNVVPKMPVQWKNVTLAPAAPPHQRHPGLQPASTASARRCWRPCRRPRRRGSCLSYITKPALNFTPGTKYQLLQLRQHPRRLMIQNVTHRSYESVLATQRLRPPLHLTRTSLPRGTAMAPLRFAATTSPADRGRHTQFAAGWSWASGGVVSTPGRAAFVRGYVSGALVNRAPGPRSSPSAPGSSEPPGPGTNYAGLGVFKYVTSCGTMYGHTGNTNGFTQFVASSADGSRGVTVSINAQITPGNNAAFFPALRHIYELAVCAAQ